MHHAPLLDERDFRRVAQLVLEHTGISLGPQKRSLVRGRLWKRLRARGLASYDAYLTLLAREPDELVELTNAITTNKTSFFREAHHHAPLVAKVAEQLRRHPGRRVSMWSAACSSGEEPYSFLVAIAEELGEEALASMHVLATDIDTRVLARAERAVYPEDALEPVPLAARERWFVRGSGERSGLVRVAKAVRTRVTFHPLNLIDERYPIRRGELSVVACRNALIYFDAATQRAVVDRLVSHLAPGGLLVLGHSESLLGNRPDLVRVGPTAWRRREDGVHR